MPTSLPTIRPVAAPRAGAFLAGASRSVFALALCWRRIASRYRQRRALAELDDHLLKDIGLTRPDAEKECRKPPWR